MRKLDMFSQLYGKSLYIRKYTYF